MHAKNIQRRLTEIPQLRRRLCVIVCAWRLTVTVIKQSISTLTELHLPTKAVNHVVSQTIIELTWLVWSSG